VRVEPGAYLHVARQDGLAILDAAAAGWDRPVPSCPDWDAAGLVRHTGGVLTWMAAVVESGERVSRRGLDPAPDGLADLESWYLRALDRTVDVLGSTDARAETWTFSTVGDHQVGWWCRRLAVEAAIHRWDAEESAAVLGGPPPDALDGQVAAAGVDEFVLEFLPGLLSVDDLEGLAGTLHLHATDGPTKWWLDLDADGASLPAPAAVDTAVRATRSDLLLWLTNRVAVDRLEVLGSPAIPAHWNQLTR
jgi:uncharacterized protein (TIGR03083 family)